MVLPLAAASVALALAAHWWLWRCGGRWGRFVVPALYLGLVGYGVWSGRLDSWWEWGKAAGALVLLLTVWGEWRSADIEQDALAAEVNPPEGIPAGDASEVVPSGGVTSRP